VFRFDRAGILVETPRDRGRLDRLAALMPPRRINLLLYLGVPGALRGRVFGSARLLRSFDSCL
jgi:hypothetical protein